MTGPPASWPPAALSSSPISPASTWRLSTANDERERYPRMGLFSSSYFRRKDVQQLIGEMNDGDRLHRRLGPRRPDRTGRRRHDRHRALRADRLRRQGGRRPVPHVVVPAGRRRLRLRRALLFGDGQHGPRGRQRLHLRLCDPGRAGRLDHRLGPHPGIRHRVQLRRRRLVQLPRCLLAKRSARPDRPAI